MAQGIKSVKPSNQVETNTVSAWNMNSAYPLFKILSVHYGNLTWDDVGNVTPVTIAHNLGYIPVVLRWLEPVVLSGGFVQNGVVSQGELYVTVDSTNVYVNANAVLFSATRGYVIYITYDNAE